MEVGNAPEWVAWIYWIGLIAGAAISISLFFSKVRHWIGEKWRRMLGQAVTHTQLKAKFATLEGQINKRFEDTLRSVSTAIDEHHILLIEKIDGLGIKVSEVAASVRDLALAIPRVNLMESMLRLAADRDDRVGTIYCDDSGAVTFVSRSLAQWLNASRSDLLGWRWLGFVPAADREGIRAEMALARNEHREVRMPVKMGPHGSRAKPYMLTMTPIPDAPPAEAWAGHISPIGHEPTDGMVA